MTTVRLTKGESQEALIRKFLRKMKKRDILKELWDRRYYEKPSAKKNKQNRKRKRILQKINKERSQEET